MDQERSEAIIQCDNPFNKDSVLTLEPTLFINDTAVQEGDIISLDLSGPVTAKVAFDTHPHTFNVLSYKRENADYVIDYNDGSLSYERSSEVFSTGEGQSLHQPGDYTIVILTQIDAPILSQNPFNKVLQFFIPIAYAYHPNLFADYLEIKVINFTIEELAEEEPPLSDLLLKYEPILQFHEQEDYFPMNVDAFVKNSGLWNSNLLADELLIQRGEDNGLTLDYLATTTVDTSDWYVSFSSDEAGTFNLAEAKQRYDKLVQNGDAVPTYYAHQSEHSYVDDLGNEHEFIVLQYWYFYAMNNWGEQGGFNDHEGYWESVFIYINKNR